MTKLPSLARAKWLKEPSLQKVFALVAGAGGEARVAGGAVRNALLGEPIGVPTLSFVGGALAAGAIVALAVTPARGQGRRAGRRA